VDSGLVSKTFHHQRSGRKLTLCGVSQQVMNGFWRTFNEGWSWSSPGTNHLDFGGDLV